MRAFSGFPAGKIRTVPLPELFFTQVLPSIESLAELKVTLHIMWRLSQKRSYPPGLPLDQLLADVNLLQSLAGPKGAAEEQIRQGLELAIARGTLLKVTLSNGQEFCFVNSEKGRQAVEQAQRGELKLGNGDVLPSPGGAAQRPNIFQLYEQNIGLLQPMIVEELKEAEQLYPAEWIEDAFREAVTRNKRNWRYIQAILESWEAEGRDGSRGDQDDRRRYVNGKYAAYLKPKPGE